MNKMINERLLQLLKTNKEILTITKQINTYIQNDKQTLKIVDAIYVNYVKTCVKTSFNIDCFIEKLNEYLKRLKKNAKAKEKLKLEDINYFEYLEYEDSNIIYHVKYEQDNKGFIFLEYENELYPVRTVKWQRLKEQTMRYVNDYNPNNIQSHNKGSTYRIIIKAPRIKLEYNYSKKKYKSSYWDVDYNIKRHTRQNIAQCQQKGL